MQFDLDEVSLAPHFSEVDTQDRFAWQPFQRFFLGKPLKRLVHSSRAAVHLTKSEVLMRGSTGTTNWSD